MCFRCDIKTDFPKSGCIYIYIYMYDTQVLEAEYSCHKHASVRCKHVTFMPLYSVIICRTFMYNYHCEKCGQCGKYGILLIKVVVK